MGERFFINRNNAALLVDRENPQRFLTEPGLFREITRDQYVAAGTLKKQWSASLSKLQGSHTGATIHIFGNGPSLKTFAAKQDWTDKLTIGINAAGDCIKPIRYWLSVDNLLANESRPLHDWVHHWLSVVRPRPVILSRSTAPWVIAHLERNTAGAQDLLPDFLFQHAAAGPMSSITDGVHWTASSVQAGLDVARHMGAARIYLWGIDYTDRSHSYTGGSQIKGDPKDNPGKPWDDFEKHVRGFKALRDACRETGIQVFNANPESKLDVFPKVQPEEAWGGGELTPPVQSVEWFTFYTSGTPYEQLAAHCVKSFSKYGLRVCAIPFPNAGDWMKNALARSQYLFSLAQIHEGKAIGLLDSDVEPLAIPMALFRSSADYTGWDRGPDCPPHDRHIACVCCFDASPRGQAILLDWAMRCAADDAPNQLLREQRYLNDAIESARATGAKISNLGPRYDRRPKCDRACQAYHPGDDTILLHTPASRTLLKVIGGRR
jgi:hypothetical protein